MSPCKPSLKTSNGSTGSLLSVDAPSEPYISRFHEHLTTDADTNTAPSTIRSYIQSHSPTSSARQRLNNGIKKILQCVRHCSFRPDHVKCERISDKMDKKPKDLRASPSVIDRLDKHGNLQPVGAQTYAPTDPMSLVFTDLYYNEYPDEHPKSPVPDNTPGPSSTTKMLYHHYRHTKAEVQAFIAQWSPGKPVPQHIPGRVWHCRTCDQFRKYKGNMSQHLREIHGMSAKQVETEVNAALPVRARPMKKTGRGGRRSYELLRDDEPSEWEEDDELNSVQNEDGGHK